MSERLLTYLDFVSKYGKRPPDIVYAITRTDTLKAVGSYLHKRYPNMSLTELGNFIDCLLKGAMPEGIKEPKVKIATQSNTRFVQLYNPRSGHYVKIDRQEGGIISHKKTAGPYKNIPIIEKRKEGKR